MRQHFVKKKRVEILRFSQMIKNITKNILIVKHKIYSFMFLCFMSY